MDRGAIQETQRYRQIAQPEAVRFSPEDGVLGESQVGCVPCKWCGQEEGKTHFCWPSYCFGKLGKNCELCSNNCLFVRGKAKAKEERIVVEELDG